MRRVAVVFNLSDAWEQWELEVPDDATEDEILAGTCEWNFLELLDGGNGYMTAVEVEEE